MSRALLILRNPEIRKRAHDWIDKAPDGTRVEFKEEKRSTAQNDRMWSILTDIASQATHSERKYGTEQWKALFMHALDQDRIEFIPALDGKTFLPIGMRSSDLSKSEMSALIDFIGCWGAEHGVVFHDKPLSEKAEKAA